MMVSGLPRVAQIKDLLFYVFSSWDWKHMLAACIPKLNTQVSLGCAARLVSPPNHLFFQNEVLSLSDS